MVSNVLMYFNFATKKNRSKTKKQKSIIKAQKLLFSKIDN